MLVWYNVVMSKATAADDKGTIWGAIRDSEEFIARKGSEGHDEQMRIGIMREVRDDL